jgi:hypothetical protein
LSLKTIFIITVATYRIIFPGLSPVVPKPGAEIPRPPVTKSLTMELYSEQPVDAQCKAEVIVPSGLRLENPAKLFIDLKQQTSDSEPLSKSETAREAFINKAYWGCSEVAPEGQPKVTKFSESENNVSAENRNVNALPSNSYAFWPRPDSKPLHDDAATPGTYTLTTNYCGNTSVTLEQEQNFLDTIELINVPKKANLDKAIKVTWKPVSNALAYLVNAYGGSGNVTVDWTSSSDPAATVGIEARPVSKEEIAKLIEKKALLPPDVTSCTIPAGIFKGSWSVFLTVIAIGADKIEIKNGIETRVLVRSVVSVPLAGTTYKPMPGEDEEKDE